MVAVNTTRLSSKGQVVIPEEIRKRMGLKPGNRFVVLGDGETLILKMIKLPDPAEFNAILAKVRKQARLAGMKRSDVKEAIRRVRARG